VTVQVAQRSKLHQFAVIPKRRVVERSFAWLEKNRRLWKSCERHINTSLPFVHLAFLALMRATAQAKIKRAAMRHSPQVGAAPTPESSPSTMVQKAHGA
jgi:transposase